MILTHLIFLNLLGGGSSAPVPTPVVVLQGGGGGKKKKFKSWDQRQAERLEQLRLDEEARNKKFGDLPKTLADALKPAPSPYKRLSPETVKAYANSRAQDDEDALHMLAALL